jgi:uncharacterized membrane protein YkoI
MKLRMVSALLFVTTFVLPGCKSSSGPGRDTTRFDPPSTEFVGRLGIAPPVSQDQAMAVAAEAAGGTAISVSQETEGAQLFFEVQVETPTGRKEVEVRASDGGVVEIEPADND